MTLKDTMLGLIIIIVWGVNFVVIAWGLTNMPPLLMGGLRFLLVFILGCWFVKRPKVPMKWILAYALIISFAQFGFLFMSMSVGMPAGLASIILQSQALFTLIFAYLFLKEKIKISQIMAIVVAGIGLAIIGLSSGSTTMSLFSFILIIMAACSWAIGNLITRSLSKKGYRADVSLVIWSALITCVPFFISSYFIEGYELIRFSIVHIDSVSIASLFYLALIATIVGYSLWGYLLSKYPAGVVAPLTLGVPVIGLLSAWVFLNEGLSLYQWIGAFIVMLGLMVNMRLDKVLKRVLIKLN